MKRSKHSLSNYKLASFDMGELIPCGLTEVLPGDSIQQATSALVRVSPLLAPLMHPVQIRIHHWFVPHRLVWDSWEDFITGGPDGEDDSAFPTKTISYTAGSPDTGSGIVGGLADYLGVPPKINGLVVSALPFRGYNLIWNEWYRDQDLQVEAVVDTGDGNDTLTATNLLNVDWEKDYFTTARPWPQKGPDVTVPLGTFAPVVTNSQNILFKPSGGAYGESAYSTATADGKITRTAGAPGTLANIQFGSQTGLQTDLSNATAASINALRLAFSLQHFQEARARFGSRYVEYLRYLGVQSSDARLQRPEYLGGGKQTLQISEVLQTAPTTDGDDSVGVGELKGHGIGAVRSNRYRRFFEEHGYVHSFISVKPKTIYAQGLPRTWNRRTKEDFWQKELQHIGSQEILNKELYAPHAQPDGVFGYQDRYDEYRRTESTIAGEFRTSLDFWHMARIFGSAPALNAAFVLSNPTQDIFATPGTDNLYAMISHSIQARRLISATGSTLGY